MPGPTGRCGKGTAPDRTRSPVGTVGYAAQGITDAFRHAELLADALDDGLGGSRPFGEALADYERRRNAAAMPMYDFTYANSALEPPTPQEQELFEAMRDDPALVGRFLGVFAGTVPVQDFFASQSPAA